MLVITIVAIVMKMANFGNFFPMSIKINLAFSNHNHDGKSTIFVLILAFRPFVIHLIIIWRKRLKWCNISTIFGETENVANFAIKF